MINSENGRRIFALEIGGLLYRYHSTKPPASTSLDSEIATGINYIDREGILTIGSFNASIDPSGGIGQYSAVTVTLAIDKKGDLGEPGTVFGRCGARSASTKAQLTNSLTRTGAQVFVDTNLTSLTYPRLMHIGGETVRASAALSTRLIVSDRGIGNTPVQNHSIDLEGSLVPEVTTEITTFRGRRAKLYGAHQYPDGSTSDYIEIINGIIEASPSVEDGQTISLSLVPLTALIDTSLSDKVNQTRLLNNYHYFDGQFGSAIEYATELNQDVTPRVYVFPDTASTLTASTYQIQLLDNSFFQTDSSLLDFDASLPKGNQADTYSEAHPRYPRFQSTFEAISSEASYPTSLTDITTGSTLTYQVYADSTISDSLTASEISPVLNIPLPRTELKSHILGDGELVQWPNVLNDVMTNDGPASANDLDGAVAKWRFDSGNQRILASKTTASRYPSTVYFWTTQNAWREHATRYARRPKFFDATGDRIELDTLSRLSYPLDMGSGNDPYIEDFREPDSHLVKSIRIEPGAPAATLELREVAKAWYQLYESVILTEGSLGLPSTATAGVYYWLTVHYYDRRSDTTKTQYFEVSHATAATFGGGTIGYKLHLKSGQNLSRNTSFGDWPNRERALITRGGRFVGERVGVALLKLLESGGGGNINGDYDELSIGLNISSDDIDEASFLRVGATSPFMLSDQYAGDGTDLRSTFESILKLLGAALVMKRDSSTGRSKIALIPIGAERSKATALTVSEGDWLVDPVPTWDIYEDIVTQIAFNYDFDPSEESYRSNVLFNDQEAINRYGGERSKVTLDLPGVSSDQFGRGVGDSYDAFVPIASRIFNLLANPLRLWRGSISTGSSIYLDLGSYLDISSSHLKGYGDSYGVTNEIGMIRSINQNLTDEGTELELITTGLAPVAWNASATVATIPTTSSMTINADDFSEDDISFFSVGDVVDYIPTGDQDNSITGLEIDSISGSTITFTANHGISTAAGTIEPTTYSNASNDHRLDGYLANVNNVLNSTIDAQKYS